MDARTSAPHSWRLALMSTHELARCTTSRERLPFSLDSLARVIEPGLVAVLIGQPV